MFPNILTDKVSRLSLFAGILFLIMTSTTFIDNAVNVVNSVCKLVGQSCTSDGTMLLLIRSLIFAVSMWFSVTYVMDPLYLRIEDRRRNM